MEADFNFVNKGIVSVTTPGSCQTQTRRKGYNRPYGRNWYNGSSHERRLWRPWNANLQGRRHILANEYNLHKFSTTSGFKFAPRHLQHNNTHEDIAKHLSTTMAPSPRTTGRGRPTDTPKAVTPTKEDAKRMREAKAKAMAEQEEQRKQKEEKRTAKRAEAARKKQEEAD